MIDEKLAASVGLENGECLKRLNDQLDQVLADYKREKLKFYPLMRLFFSNNKLDFIYNFLAIFLCSLSLFISLDESLSPNTWNAIIILIISFFNLSIIIVECVQTHTLIYGKAKNLLKSIQNFLRQYDSLTSIEVKNKIFEQFENFDLAFTHSISTQLTIRENKILNLPLNLVVKDDLILLKTGQIVNVNCRSLLKNKVTNDYDYYEIGQVYDSSCNENENTFQSHKTTLNEFVNESNNNNNTKRHYSYHDLQSLFKIKNIPKTRVFICMETPYLNYLKSVLNNYKPDSDSIISNEIKKVRKLLLYFFIPCVFSIQVFVSFFYYLFLRDEVSSQVVVETNKFNKTFWINLSYVIVPLLPVAFTFFWKITTLHGTVCLLKMESTLKKVFFNNATHSGSNDNNNINHNNTNNSMVNSNTNDKTYSKANDSKSEEVLLLSRRRRSSTLRKSLNDEHRLSSSIRNKKLSTISSMTNDEINLNEMMGSLNKGLTSTNCNNSVTGNNNNDENNDDLASIESLIASIQIYDDQMQDLEEMDKNEIKKFKFFHRILKPIRFYFKIAKIVLFGTCSLDFNQLKDYEENLKNAQFIYFSNFLIGLGIITNFSCIDKEGILSWPNPTADKIWFFNQNSNNSKNTNKPTSEPNITTQEPQNKQQISKGSGKSHPKEKFTLETYNLTHDYLNGYELKFDDTNWDRNLSSLKPLGLSILLNTCNKQVTNNYSNFFGFLKLQQNEWLQSCIVHHLTRANLHQSANNQTNPDEEPTTTNNNNLKNNSLSSCLNMIEDSFELKDITDRRCLCEISNIIGFDRETAMKAYDIVGTYSAIRNLEIKSNSKLKPKQLHLSSVFSVIAKCSLNGMNNIYSEGSLDLILDFCHDFWNGKSITELTKAQKKSLLDLYQRQSASTYCMAFSYKPLFDEELELLQKYKLVNKLSTNCSIESICNSAHTVLEFPSSYCDKISNLESILDNADHHATEDESSFSDSSILDSLDNQSLNGLKDCQQNELSVIDNEADELNKIKAILELGSNQIFLGMVSMQHRAKPDVIKLVEKLEKSCIRFVHFSYENEHKSKAFAEMLGLDTGWNCHISLANDINNSSVSKLNLNLNSNANMLLKPSSLKSPWLMNITKPMMNKFTLRTNFHSKSLPTLKLTKEQLALAREGSKKFWKMPKKKAAKLVNHTESTDATMQTDQENMLSSSIQIVKFNLTNIEESNDCQEINEHEEEKEKVSSKRKKLIRLNSFDRTSSLSSISNYSSISSSSSSSSLKLIARKIQLNASLKKNSKQNLDPKAKSTSTLKSNSSRSKSNTTSSRKEPSKIAKQNSANNNEESLSHRSNSVVSLSETEIFGNAAQLPKGIDNIRRHLDMNIDNVPLHVSLFTDSSKWSINQMIQIMKDYGELVCCLGSSHSIENNLIFSVSNVSIGIEPLYPRMCISDKSSTCKTEYATKASSNDLLNNNGKEKRQKHINQINITPQSLPNLINISTSMNTLSCGLNLNRDNMCMLPPLMSLAREMVYSYRIALVFMLMSNISVSLVQLICNLLFLPPILSGFQVLFLILFTIPLLSYSLIHKNESNDLRCSTKKNLNLINKEDIKSFAIKYLIKFFPSMLVLILFHFLSLYFKCKKENENYWTNNYNGSNVTNGNFSFNATDPASIHLAFTSDNNQYKCQLFAFDLLNIKQNSSNAYNYWSKSQSVQFSQLFNHFFLTVYFVFISVNFVSIEKSIWSYIPFRNKTWTKTIIFILIIHFVYFFIMLFKKNQHLVYFKTIPIQFWILTIIWPILLLVFNEIYKVFESKEILRQYKKIRLDFDTKLGMNSPFV